MIELLIVIALGAALLAVVLLVKHRARRARGRRMPVSAACRAARASRVRLIDNMDEVSIAYMCEFRHASELAGMQQWIDRLAENDRKGAGR